MPAGQKHRLHEHTGTPKILCEALEQNRIPEDYKTLYKITHFAIDDVFCCLLVVPKDGNAVTIVDHRVRCICLCCDVIMWLRKHIIVNLALVPERRNIDERKRTCSRTTCASACWRTDKWITKGANDGQGRRMKNKSGLKHHRRTEKVNIGQVTTTGSESAAKERQEVFDKYPVTISA